jgi:hypothetical protein
MRVWSWWPGWKTRRAETKASPSVRDPRRAGGARRRLAAGVAALVMTSGLLVAGGGAASAGDAGRVSAGQAIAGGRAAGDGWLISGVTSSGSAFLGPLSDPTGGADWVWCINMGLNPPSGSVSIETVSGADAAAMAWLLDKLQYDPASIGVADRGLSNAAGSYLVHMHYDEGNKAGVTGEARKAAVEAAAWSGLTAEADRLWDLATSSTDLSAQTEVQTYDLGTQRTGTIGNIGIQNGRGEWVAGIDFTTTLTGGAVFDTNGNGQADSNETGTYSGVTADQPIELRWVAGPGVQDVHGSSEYSASRAVLNRLRAGAAYQDSLRKASDDPEVLGSAGVRFRAVGDFRPEGISTAPAAVSFGEVLSDLFVPAVAEGDTWVSVDGAPVPVTYSWEVYDVGSTPVAGSDSAPSGTPVFSGTAVATGPGEALTVQAGIAPASSTYVWVWSTSKALQPEATADYVRDVVWTDGTTTEETSVVRWQVEHSSITREYNIVPGGRVFDTITIAGFPDDHGQFAGLDRFAADVTEAAVTVYGPLESRPTTSEVPAGTPVFWADTLASVNGTFNVGWDEANPIVAPTSATYAGGDYFVFVYSFAGDARVEAYTSAFDDLAETWFIPANPTSTPVVGPWLITAADTEVVAGEPFGDTAYLTGDVDGGYLVFEAYGPFTEGTTPVEDPASLMWTSQQVPVDGVGVYRSGATSAVLPVGAQTGDVYWVATYYDADGSQIMRGRFGDASEITTVVAPVAPGLVTEAAVYASESGELTAIPVAGDSTRDVIRPENDAVFEAGSTAVSRLYFAPEGTDLVCTAEQLVFTPAAIDLADESEYLSDAYTTPVGVAGTYGWVETGYGPDGSVFDQGACGEPSETVDVVAVSTTLGHEDTNGDGLAGAGDELWDDIHLTGTLPAGAEVALSSTVYELTADQITWGEAAINTGAGNITVASDVCTPEALYTTLTVTEVVTEPGTYSTGRFTVPGAGERVIGGLTMVETAQITVGDQTRTVTGVCGAPDESVGPVYFGSGGGGSGAAASQLAITGVSRLGGLLALAMVLGLGGGSLARWAEHRKRRQDAAA